MTKKQVLNKSLIYYNNIRNRDMANKLVFYSVKNARCDFCNRIMTTLTQVNDTYICHKCAPEINKHARNNAYVYKAKVLTGKK